MLKANQTAADALTLFIPSRLAGFKRLPIHGVVAVLAQLDAGSTRMVLKN